MVTKSILQRLKQIRLPRVVLYDLADESIGYELSPPRTIYAHRAENEIAVCLDPEGQLYTSRQDDAQLQALETIFVRPHVTFLDKTGRPILLIHLISENRRAGLSDQDQASYSMMGIDAVQVLVPRQSQEAIERIFFVSSSTYWLYNHEHATTPPGRIPARAVKNAISELDIRQRTILEESARCRKNRINNLIRAIGAYLKSQSGLQLAANLEAETAALERRIADRTEGFRATIRDRYRQEAEQTGREKTELTQINSDLANGLPSYRSESEQNRRQHLAQKKQALTQKMSALRLDMRAKRNELQQLSAAPLPSGLTPELSSLTEKLTRLTEQLTRQEAENEILNTRVQTRQNELTRYSTELATISANNSTLGSQSTQLQSDCRNMENSLLMSREKLTRLTLNLSTLLKQQNTTHQQQLSDLDEKQARRLTTEILSEFPPDLQALKTCFQDGRPLAIITMKNELTTSSAKLSKNLTTVLGRLGISPDDFLAQLAQHQ